MLTPPHRRAGLGRQALVVDADPTRRARILVVLEAEGYAVITLDSAGDAHVVVQRLIPAVIVLDGHGRTAWGGTGVPRSTPSVEEQRVVSA